MSGRPERAEELRWLLEPPAQGDVRLVIELGENARLTPAAEQALERLMKELYSTDVQGYAYAGAVQSLMLGRPALQDCQLECSRLRCGAFIAK
jgi:hypothetical protein